MRAPRSRLWPIGVVLILLMHAGALVLLGQPWICECGIIEIWHGTVLDTGNSQHLFDWYTLSHIIHGLLFYFGLTVLFPRLSFAQKIILSVLLESAWEILENSPIIINRYREQALALGYFGDSIVNSLGDALAALAGFSAAARFPVWISIALVVCLELLALIEIRDNLTLNVIQLIHPIEAIGAWQAGE